jgi:hypothetical protein
MLEVPASPLFKTIHSSAFSVNFISIGTQLQFTIRDGLSSCHVLWLNL